MVEDRGNAGMTPERAARGKVQVTERGATPGGIAAAEGYQDDWHFYLDFLADLGELGRAARGRHRRDHGLAFRELYVRTHPSQKSFMRDAGARGLAMDRPVNAGDLGDPADRLNREWILASGYLRPHMPVLMKYCVEIEDVPPYPVSLAGIEEKIRQARKVLKKSSGDDEKQAGFILSALLAEYGRIKARREMQESIITAHVKAFRLSRDCRALLRALDALPDALARAHAEAWAEEIV